MDEFDFLKQTWDFAKNLASDSAAPWVNRALPHLVSPLFKYVHPRLSLVRSGLGKLLAATVNGA